MGLDIVPSPRSLRRRWPPPRPSRGTAPWASFEFRGILWRHCAVAEALSKGSSVLLVIGGGDSVPLPRLLGFDENISPTFPLAAAPLELPRGQGSARYRSSGGLTHGTYPHGRQLEDEPDHLEPGTAISFRAWQWHVRRWMMVYLSARSWSSAVHRHPHRPDHRWMPTNSASSMVRRTSIHDNGAYTGEISTGNQQARCHLRCHGHRSVARAQ